MTVSNPIIILGMHRSGTSCLAGCLEEAGLYLGDVNISAPFNAKGNRENQAVMRLHDAILRRVGAAWDKPPVFDPVWTRNELSKLEKIIEAFTDKPIWGVKEPRSAFMMQGWQRLTSPRFVGTFRHPVEVATSLVNRAKAWEQEMDMDRALRLWTTYNTRLLAHHRQAPFDVIRYDISVEAYNEKLKTIITALSLPEPDYVSFREEGLQNYHADSVDVPESCRAVWDALNDVSI